LKNKINIIYEDNDILAIDKEAGVLSIPDRFDQGKVNYLTMLKKLYSDIIPVHRLDKDTSGVLLFAKNEVSHKLLNQLFENGEITKFYYALAVGTPIPEAGLIELSIASDPSKPGRMKIYAKGKPSKTAYEIIEKFKSYSWIKLQLYTGRTHQIRVHMAAIGHPLAVDPTYNNKEALYIHDIKKGVRPVENPIPLVQRTTLHAGKVIFKHPITNLNIEITAPLPKDLNALLNQLRKWNKR
jgi:23S rRNA pseudouridine1911/1915/1917 synthase